MTFLSLDFETSGLSANQCAPMSLGIVGWRDGQIANRREYKFRVYPEMAYYPRALEVNGLCLDDLKEGWGDAEVVADVAEVFADWADAPIVSHNATFDSAFWSQVMYRSKVKPDPLRGEWACTRRMASVLGLPNVKLDTCLAHFGMKREGTVHGALEDAELCGKLYMRLKA